MMGWPVSREKRPPGIREFSVWSTWVQLKKAKLGLHPREWPERERARHSQRSLAEYGQMIQRYCRGDLGVNGDGWTG